MSSECFFFFLKSSPLEPELKIQFHCLHNKIATDTQSRESAFESHIEVDKQQRDKREKEH